MLHTTVLTTLAVLLVYATSATAGDFETDYAKVLSAAKANEAAAIVSDTNPVRQERTILIPAEDGLRGALYSKTLGPNKDQTGLLVKVWKRDASGTLDADFSTFYYDLDGNRSVELIRGASSREFLNAGKEDQTVFEEAIQLIASNIVM